MSERLTVIYNGACPICAPEIRAYRRQAEAADAPVDFVDLTEGGAERFGLSRDAAARRLYVVTPGGRLSGIDAFLALWRQLPQMRWLARLIDRPVLRGITAWGYERIAAPLLYRLHKRRESA